MHESEAFHRVGRALIANWPHWSSHVEAGDRALRVARQRNLLLDETGSDYRPLVDLLIDLGEVTRPALQRCTSTPLSASAWDTARAPMVHHIVSTRYLQPDVARWAVDVWARALGVSPPTGTPDSAAAPHVQLSEHTPQDARLDGPAAATTGTARTHSTSRSGTPAPSTAARPATSRPVRPNAPSWAGGPASFGVGAKVKPGARAALANSGRLVSHTPYTKGPRFQPVERLAAAIFAGLLAMIVIMTFAQKYGTSEYSLRNSSRGRRAGENVIVTRADAVVPDTEVNAAVPAASPAAPDSVGLSASLHNHVPNDAPRDTPAVSPMIAGVDGRYRVTQRIRSVDGSASCASVATALGVGRETEERITHVAGNAVFRIESRGVQGTLDPSGYFVAGPLTGTSNNIPWRFQMRGQFSADGFSGVSETYTQAIIRWGRTQSCVVTADLTAIRLPG